MIQCFQSIDVRGIRRLSAMLPQFLLPNPNKFGQIILKTPDDIRLLINPAIDKSVELSLYETGIYEAGVLSYIKQNFQQKGAFIDVGANIGLMSLFVARHFSQAQVYAYEAHPDTFDILKKNCSLNAFSKNIEIHHLAIASKKEQLKIINDKDDNRGGAFLSSQLNDGFDIACDSLDSLLSSMKIEMIKIDVEGFEFEVLKGAKSIISTEKPKLIIEISQARDKDQQTIEIWNFVKQMNYSVFKLKGGKGRKSKLIEVKSMDDLPQHDNIICIYP